MAQALIVGGIASLLIGLAVSLLIGYVVRDESLDHVAGLLTISTGTNVAGVSFGVGFPLTVAGLVLAWLYRPEADSETWADEAEGEAPE